MFKSSNPNVGRSAKLDFDLLWNKDSESVVFNSGQKMALRVVYVVIC